MVVVHVYQESYDTNVGTRKPAEGNSVARSSSKKIFNEEIQKFKKMYYIQRHQVQYTEDFYDDD